MPWALHRASAPSIASLTSVWSFSSCAFRAPSTCSMTDVRQLGARDHRDEIHVQLHTVQVTHEQSFHFRATERRLDLATCRFHATKVHLRFVRENAGVDAALVQPDGCVAVRHCDALRRVTRSAPIIPRHSVLSPVEIVRFAGGFRHQPQGRFSNQPTRTLTIGRTDWTSRQATSEVETSPERACRTSTA